MSTVITILSETISVPAEPSQEQQEGLNVFAYHNWIPSGGEVFCSFGERDVKYSAICCFLRELVRLQPEAKGHMLCLDEDGEKFRLELRDGKVYDIPYKSVLDPDRATEV